MRIGAYDDDQIAAVLEMWHVGRPIDVAAFLQRKDVPTDSKHRVRIAGLHNTPPFMDAIGSYHRMQRQIIIEIVTLDQQIWKPFGEDI